MAPTCTRRRDAATRRLRIARARWDPTGPQGRAVHLSGTDPARGGIIPEGIGAGRGGSPALNHCVVTPLPEEDAHDSVAWRCDQRSEEHTSELQSHSDIVCRLLLEKKKKRKQ